MSNNLTITKNYADGTILFQDDFDQIVASFEDFFNSTKITDDNILDASLTASDKLVDSSITSVKIKPLNITGDLFLNETFTSSRIAPSAATTAKIAPAAITAAKVASEAFTTAKFPNLVVTRAKLTDCNYSHSDGGTLNVTGTTPTLYTSTSLTTHGNPVEIRLIPTVGTIPASSGSSLTAASVFGGGGHDAYSILTLQRDGTTIAIHDYRDIVNSEITAGAGLVSIFPSWGPFLDAPSTGTHTYSILFHNSESSASLAVARFTLFIREL